MIDVGLALAMTVFPLLLSGREAKPKNDYYCNCFGEIVVALKGREGAPSIINLQ